MDEKECPEIGHQELDGTNSDGNLLERRKRPTRAHRAKTSNGRELMRALESSGHFMAMPRPHPRKIDLSYHPPRSSTYHPPRSSSKRAGHLRKLSPELSLRYLLARYIRFVHPYLVVRSLQDRSPNPFQKSPAGTSILQALARNVDEKALEFLHANGYKVTDLVTWCWILTAPSSLGAARRLAMMSEPSISKSFSAGRPIPTFVFLFLLRREHVDAHALQILIMHAKQRLHFRRSSLRISNMASEVGAAVKSDAWSLRRWKQPQPGLIYPIMSETTLMTMFVRLIRHARKALPAALTSIIILFSQYMHGQSNRNGSSEMVPDERTSARLTFLYNKALHLLAIPSSQHPFLSIPQHQRAQFILLRRMNEFSPALIINREGYRAIALVQLAHRKSIRERDWAGLKVNSWPPWKEDKLGLDVEKGLEYGTSRAGEALMRLSEAGYGTEPWEYAAKIYAGWDTDHSPTIQTRAIFPHGGLSTGQENQGEIKEHAVKWRARIRATRTLNEAWACFLAWQKKDLPPSSGVYYAMLEKLVFNRKRQNVRGKPDALECTPGVNWKVLPGDGKEVWPEPISPQEVTYVSTTPPNIEELFDSMVARNVRPSGRFLAFLISHAESLKSAVKYIEASELPAETVRMLVDAREDKIDEMQDTLAQMPDYLFAAYIRLLSRHPHLEDGLSAFDESSGLPFQVSSRHGLFDRGRLAYAFRLIVAKQPRYLPAWYCILAAIAHPRSVIVASPDLDEDAQALLSWILMRKALGYMQAMDLSMDFRGFQILCIGLEKAALASKRYLSGRVPQAEKNDKRANLISEAQDLRSTGLPIVKAKFTELISSPFVMEDRRAPAQSIDSARQALFEAPGPAQLHAFIRVLGLYQDYDGLLTLILWMVQFASELEAVSDEASNGVSLTRRCIISTRVFLERSWLSNGNEGVVDEHYCGSIHEVAPPETVLAAVEAIESVEAWGGWPTEQEVEAYCRKGRFM